MSTLINKTWAKVGMVLAIVALVGIPAIKAQAEGLGLTIQPVKVSQTLKPGESVQGKILLTNASDEDINVDVGVEDFIPTAGEETIQFVGRAEGVTTARDWVTIDDSVNFIFKENESKEIPYTITAPANAEPGSHFAVAFFKATKIGENGEQLKIGTRVGVLILITVPGNHLQKGVIHDFTTEPFIQKGPVNFSMTFENTGTVHFEPKGKIKVTNMFGKQVAEVPVEGQVVLPTGKKDIVTEWTTGRFLLGKYNASASILDGEGNELTTQTISFWAFPVWYVLGLLIALIAVFFIIKFIKSKVHISISMKQ